MGRYLDIAKRVERQRSTEGHTPAEHLASPPPLPDYRLWYRQMAESVSDDCDDIDPDWLLSQPELWEKVKSLDETLSRMEREGGAEHVYRHTLACLVACIREAKSLYERERQRGHEKGMQ